MGTKGFVWQSMVATGFTGLIILSNSFFSSQNSLIEKREKRESLSVLSNNKKCSFSQKNQTKRKKFNDSYRIIRMKVTAYCPCKKCCGKFANGKTATGKNAYLPGVAADPKLLPYGTKLEIPGVGIRIVDDTGGAMRAAGKKGIYHIDVRMETHQEAKKFGVKWLNVKVFN